MLDSALLLADKDFHLFPADHPGLPQCAGRARGHDPATCTDRGKHPAVAFTRNHSTDRAKLAYWFHTQQHNIGIAVGACRGPAGERLLVVDSDRPGAIEDTAAALGRKWLPTMRVTTAKGYHDYLWAPRTMKLGNGLGSLRGRFDGDVRAGNAYVIGPGSVHATGVIYELVDPEQQPAPAPAWLLTALQAAPERPTAVPAQGPRKASGRLTPLVRFVLESQPKQRNNRLYWAACRAFEQMTAAPPNIASALLDAATHIGLSEAEARQTITSAYRSRAAR
ncbi:bifunctional DNA primase/polymerase [Streptomyces sp. NTH33]|uniref:bifunctional DNA primase/polymerase n=1 Tax=Streptomyces sp. NTH33 TaxID=1735453 RepID=UPI0021ABDDF9|nr:bifunctional DNA primase/polymerase [Streptomyces sp. NTH33]